MSFRPPASSARSVLDLHNKLVAENVLHDIDDPRSVARLTADARRMARDMDEPDRPPPMYWTGIPWPRRDEVDDCDWCLTISVGGTNTLFLLSRLCGGDIEAISRDGRTISGSELADARKLCRLPTPTALDTPSGGAMVRRIVEHVAEYLRPHAALLPNVRHVLLGWGFPHRVVRTKDWLLGGIAAVTTRMTKDQSSFTDLVGQDIGEIFARELEAALDWRRPVTVANDSVVALHYFLSRRNRERFAQIGLFINGTGANFCLAEPYHLRPEGVQSRPGEAYEPPRLVSDGAPAGAVDAVDRDLADGSSIRRYFVNYEIGSVELIATRSRFDVVDDYPIESNVLSGGNAFEQQFRAFFEHAFGHGAYGELCEAAQRGPFAKGAIEGPEVARLAGSTREQEVLDFMPGFLREPISAGVELVRYIAQAVIARSALHAALILAAVTERRRFGRGDSRGRPDLLAIEGSVWKAPRYKELVLEAWRKLAGGDLRVEIGWEPNYAASARGPLYVTLLQRESPESEGEGRTEGR